MSQIPESEELSPSPPRGLRSIGAETAVVLLVCVVPLIFQSAALSYVPRPATPFVYQAVHLILRSTANIALIAFLVLRSGEPVARFGLSRLKRKDLAVGVVVFIGAQVAWYCAWYAITALLDRGTAADLGRQDLRALSAPSGQWQVALCIVMCFFNGAAEELVMRAYLIPRFEQLFDSTLLSVLLSSVLFASYHSYQGTGGMISVAVIGLFYGTVFCVLRRAWPLAVAHGLQDMIGFLFLSMR